MSCVSRLWLGWRVVGFLICACLGACERPDAAAPLDDDQPRAMPAPNRPMSALPVAHVTVNAKDATGPLEAWRQSLGHGGINSTPLPDRVVDGVAKLRPRLIRVFIQEFFVVYPEHGRFDWSKLDPYMDALDRTGAKVVAAITIKPKPIYPKVDPGVWRPNDVAEWQRVIHAMVKRYSVDKQIVTYWEIGNETDIGENGGCPYLIPDPAQYAEYYKMTIRPILDAFPAAKVGGPAVANAGGDYLARFVECCAKEKMQLDFVSWHLYSDDPEQHAGLVQKYRKLLAQYPGKRPEMLVTEWSKGFDPVSVEEMAFEPRRAAITASSIIAMIDAGVDWSFYYHIWDQVCHMDEFRPFFQNPDIMYHHWNEVPHRFGLFGVGQEVRPQYFVYQMLNRMGDRRLRAESSEKDLRVLAGRSDAAVSVMLVNYGRPRSEDRVASVRLSGLTPGAKWLRTYRIDRTLAWSPRRIELLRLENRQVDVKEEFTCHVYCPADSVTMMVLEDGR